ncbi:MAG: glycoside hydrolase family 16 protein [Bacteroidales bacterium]|nr:glycoside hydrolase family 16 protein [Bacteroidales bacterium]
MKTKIMVLFSCLFMGLYALSQTPATDLHWEIYFHDDFDSTINEEYWDFKPPWGSCHGKHSAALTENINNRKIENGILKLFVCQENCQCTTWNNNVYNVLYSSGAIFSKQAYKYGFFEIYIKIPELKNSLYTGKGLGPNFWLWPTSPNAYNPNLTDVRWSEIDIYEFDGEDNKHTCNVHYEDIYNNDGNSQTATWNLRQNADYDFIVDFSSFHKFGCEWTPTYISFYYDDKLIRTTYTDFSDDLLPMNLIIDNNIPASNFLKTPVSNTLFPYLYEIEYIKIYKLTMDCDIDINENDFNYSTYNFKVKRNVTIGGNQGCVPLGQSFSIRATQSIILNNGFEVPLGSEFYANICQCEN